MHQSSVCSTPARQDGNTCIMPPRFKLYPSMVTWAPSNTLCRGQGEGGSSAGSDDSGRTGRTRRRGAAVKLAVSTPSTPATPYTPSTPATAGSPSLRFSFPECTHQVASVENLPSEGNSISFLVRSAWSPGQLAARLLLPGACEFAGAVAQTQAYTSLRGRLTASASMSANVAVKSAAVVASKGHRTLPAIPVSQL